MKQQTLLLNKTKLVAAVSLLSFSMAVSAAPLFPSTLKLSSLATPLIDSVADDFNGDGNIDLAVVLKSTPVGGVQVLLGNDSGGLVVASGVATGNNPGAVAAGDFNADGKTDLVVVNTDDNNISVLLGDGSGAFAATPGSPISVGSTPLDAVVDDFNGDGKMDIAVTNAADNTVSILLGDGSGSFIAIAGLPVTDTGPVAIVAGDVNADSKVDLLVANTFADTVSVLLGDGTGSFNPAVSPVTGNKPIALALADFNADGKPDLAVANSDSASVTVLLGNGSGGFNAIASPYTVGSKPIDLKVADVNGDGTLDIVTANLNDSNFSVLPGNGSGGFGAVINTANSAQPLSIVLNDFDGDGNIDISTSNSDATTAQLWGKGNGKFHSTVKKFSVANSPSSIAIGDVNNDGSVDLVVASSPGTGGNIKVLANSGTGDFSNLLTTATLGTISALSKVALANVAGDANLDMVVSNSADNTVAVLTGNGAGFFVPVTGSPFAVGDQPMALAIGDMNNDSKADIVVANKASNNVSLLKNTGSDSFVTSATLSVGAGASPVSIVLIDQNADGNLDVISANQGSDNLTLGLGNGAGGLAGVVSTSPVVGSEPASIVIGDLDGDALADRITVNRGNDTLDILLGSGSQHTITVEGGPDAIVIGDFNGDNKPDLAVLTPGVNILGGSSFDSLLYLLLGDGNGNFSIAPQFPFTVDKLGFGGVDLAAADFNGDGLTDLALVNDNSPVVQVLLNLDPRPAAKTDTVTTNQNSAVTTGNVLGNDIDANQTGSLTIASVDTNSVHGGSITNNGDNTFTYLPAAGFTGTDSFNYTITDGWTKTASGKVNVTVNAAPAAPAAPSGGGGSLNLYLLLLLSGFFFLRCRR